MNKKPLISIIVTSYNYGHFIGQTLESLTNQTFNDFEVIVVDDGSTDNSVEIIERYTEKDSRIKLFFHEGKVNRGLTDSVKYAVSLANGKYICFCESDDYFEPNHLEEKAKIIEKFPKADIIANYPNMFGDEGIVEFKHIEFEPFFKVMRNIKKPKNVFFEAIKANELVFPTFSIVMVKAKALKKCDFSPKVITSAIDVWLWKQLLLKCKVYYIDKPLTNWRLHKNSVTQTFKTDKAEEFTKAIYKSLELSLIQRFRLYILKNNINLNPILIKKNEKGLHLTILRKLRMYIYRNDWFN